MKRLERLWGALDRHPTITDGAVAALLAVFALLEIRLAWRFVQPLPGNAAVALTLLLFAPLAWRRRFPLVVLAAMTPAAILFRSFDVPELTWSANAWWLAAYSAGAYGSDRWRTPVRAVAFAAMAGWIGYELFIADHPEFGGDLLLLRTLALLANGAFFAWVWWFGDVMRVRRTRELQLAERTVQLEREREENARRAVLEERVHIARELHDVVAHHVSLMGVQAGAARRVLARQPEQVEEVLTTIEATSRQAVLELHRLLGFLRRDEEDDPLAPQPGLRQLDLLVTQMREAGLPVDLAVEGDTRPLPPGVDLSAYRIVQEALTNTLKHAGPARAAVTVRYGDRALEIEITDDGRGPTSAGNDTAGGNGLMGMRERVGLLGGRLQVGHHPGVGFSVRAHLPLDGRPA